jgi:hypothetical protein
MAKLMVRIKVMGKERQSKRIKDLWKKVET